MEIRQQEVPWVKHDNGKHQNKMEKKERRGEDESVIAVL
jgi:hypothetical protein